MKIAALFPGQGSQAVGMGRQFLEASEEARTIASQANKALGFDLTKLCLEGPLETLTLTENAQPAILTTSYIAFKLAGVPVQAAAGHSLGEYTALVSAGCLKFEDAVALVNKRGRYMQEAVKPGDGKMAAIMGPGEQEIKDVISKLGLATVQIANLNSPGQIVVAGDAAGVTAFCDEIAKSGAKAIPLNVSAPFHCVLMKPAAERLTVDLDATDFTNPSVPVYSNVSSKPISSGSEARELLKQQVCAPVRWTDSMVNLIEGEQITHTVEFGAGGVLTKLLKRINKEVPKFEVEGPESLTKTKQALGL